MADVDDERALAEADAADARLAAARGEGAGALDALHPLLGIPVALKDLVSVEGGQCTAGSRILEGYRAPFDAHITKRLRDAGAVILGKTNMDEFAMGSSTEHSAFGPTGNPWDLGRVPAGPAAARRPRLLRTRCRSPIGTDTGGSIRQPAAMCGIVGIKPTYGRVSRYGIVAFASSLDQVGPFGRDARDAAALLHAVAGRDERDSTSAPVPGPGRPAAPARLGRRGSVLAPWPALRAAEGVLRRGHGARRRGPVREAVAELEAAGATVEEVSLPHTDYGLAAYYIVAPAEASANLARYDGVRFGYSVRGGDDYLADYLATRGAGVRAGGQAPDHARHLRALGRLLRRVLPEGAEGPDADQARLRHPVGRRASTRSSRPRRRPSRCRSARGWTTRSRCTWRTPARCRVNMAGLPGISVPCGLSDGLPVGLQLIGAAWSEGRCSGRPRLRGGDGWGRVATVRPRDLATLETRSIQTPAERASAAA